MYIYCQWCHWLSIDKMTKRRDLVSLALFGSSSKFGEERKTNVSLFFVIYWEFTSLEFNKKMSSYLLQGNKICIEICTCFKVHKTHKKQGQWWKEIDNIYQFSLYFYFHSLRLFFPKCLHLSHSNFEYNIFTSWWKKIKNKIKISTTIFWFLMKSSWDNFYQTINFL